MLLSSSSLLVVEGAAMLMHEGVLLLLLLGGVTIHCLFVLMSGLGVKSIKWSVLICQRGICGHHGGLRRRL